MLQVGSSCCSCKTETDILKTNVPYINTGDGKIEFPLGLKSHTK